MEIRAYFRVLARKWWILLVVFAATFLTTYIWTSKQPWIYETRSTFVIRPRSALVANDDFVRTLDIVSRRAEINATFAEVANSKLIKDLAIEQLQLSAGQRNGLLVNARVVGGANILELTIQGRDPWVIKNFADAVGNETVNYVSKLYDIFEIELLDQADLPGHPIKPDVALNLLLGASLGLGLGICIVFLIHYLETPHDAEAESFNIIDRQTGAYNKSFFLLRLWQEMSRAKRNKYPLSLGLIKIELKSGEEVTSPHDQAEALRNIRILTEKILREEDVLARFNDDILTIMLPDTPVEKAKSIMEKIKSDIHAIAFDIKDGNKNLVLNNLVSVIAYHNNPAQMEQFLIRAIQALRSEEVVYDEEVILFSNNHHSNHLTIVKSPGDMTIS